MELDLDSVISYIQKSISRRSGKNMVVLNIKKISSICDYFVIASGTSVRQVKLIADEIENELSKQNINILRKEGYDSGRWILLDYGDIVIHIFHEKEREFYNIEGIWKDAAKVYIDIN